MYRKNTASQFVCFQMLLTATGAVATGLAPAVRRCIDGTFAAGGGTVTEDGTTGSYKYAMSQADTNGNDISFIFSAATAMPVCVNIVTTAADPTDSVRLGLTALPNAAANAAGGLPISIAGALDLDEMNADIEAIQTSTAPLTFTVANQVDVNVLDWKSATAPAMTGDAFARLGAPAGASVSADVAAVKSDSGAIKTQTDKLAFTVANQVDSNVLDWKSATAPAMTGDAFARLGAPAGASVSADVAAIKSDTGTVLTDVNTGAGAIYTRLGAPAGASIAADVAAVKTDTAAVKVQTDKLTFTVANKVDANTLAMNGDATAAANVAKSMHAIARGVCSGGTTTTAVVSSMTSPSSLGAAGQLIGRTILFDADTATTNLQGQASNITNNTTGATPTITFTALTTAPGNGDTFSVV